MGLSKQHASFLSSRTNSRVAVGSSVDHYACHSNDAASAGGSLSAAHGPLANGYVCIPLLARNGSMAEGYGLPDAQRQLQFRLSGAGVGADEDAESQAEQLFSQLLPQSQRILLAQERFHERVAASNRAHQPQPEPSRAWKKGLKRGRSHDSTASSNSTSSTSRQGAYSSSEPSDLPPPYSA